MIRNEIERKELYDKLSDNQKIIIDTYDNKLSNLQWVNLLNNLNCKNLHDWEFRYSYTENGILKLYNQCCKCGVKSTIGHSLKFNLVPNLKEKIAAGTINEFDYELEQFHSPTSENYHSYNFIKWFDERIIEAKKQELEAVNRRKFYNDYIASDKWKAIRLKVLKRDNNLCQACLEAPAQDVHHITYANLGDELMFELLSVCRDCHFNRIHK